MIHKIAEKFGMESNGYAMFHDENFEKHWDLPCYIPENAEDEDDIFTREDIKALVVEWLERDDVKEYLLESHDNIMPTIDNEFIEGWVRNVYDSLEWTSPSTILENYTY